MEPVVKNIVTGVGIIAGGIAVFKLYKKLNPSGTDNADSDEKAANTKFVQDNKTLLQKYLKLKKPTYPDSYFAGWKTTLYKAMDGVGTSEPAILNVFGYMKSDTDVVKLIDAFGIMNRKTNNPFSSEAVPLSLNGWLAEEMGSDVWKVNKILSDKKIGYRF